VGIGAAESVLTSIQTFVMDKSQAPEHPTDTAVGKEEIFCDTCYKAYAVVKGYIITFAQYFNTTANTLTR